MLTYITVTVENNCYRGGIEIKSTVATDSVGSVSSILISRKDRSKTGWTELYTRAIESVEDFNFNLFDITAISGKSYDYAFDVKAGNNVIESQIIDNINCWFDGLFVGNFNEQYIAGSNYKTDTKRNTEVNYVTTLGSRTPYRVSNGLSNYTTGTSEGLFLKVTSDGKRFIPDVDHSYSTQVLDFLSDGTGKILKTHDGQIWYISIDNTPATPYNNGFEGMNSVTFSWTEIGDVPVFGAVVE